jgi:hypothetical protein
MTTIINGSSPSITFSDTTTQSSGVTNITAGVVGVASGGTGAATLTANNVLLGNGTSALQVVAPGTNGNILTSNGTTWTSTAPAAGGVTSVATGNGLSGGTITSSGTLIIACPTYNTVGSYVSAAVTILQNVSNTVTGGSNYSVGSGNGQISALLFRGIYSIDATVRISNTNNLSGTWKWMGGTGTVNIGCCNTSAWMGVACRVA